MKLKRFGVSIEEGLLYEFDTSIKEKGYTNRSEALRDLVRLSLFKDRQVDEEAVAFGVISFTYDHHKKELAGKLTRLGHSRRQDIISSMHFHLDRIHCLEVIVAKGRIKGLRDLTQRITAKEGVLQGELVIHPIPGA